MSESEITVFLVIVVVTAAVLVRPASPATDTLVYGGCSQLKFVPGSSYESNVNSVLSSLVNSASFTTFANFTGAAGGSDTVYGLFQCRGDLQASECSRCVSQAVTKMVSLCGSSRACGGAVQFEGCFVKYDNASFLGVQDKTLVLKNCGPTPTEGYGDQVALATGIDQTMAYLAAADGGGGLYRTGGSDNGDVRGVAQCVGDLSPSKCQDCITEAIGRLRSDCRFAARADVYLGKCYARYWDAGRLGRDSNNNGGKNKKDDETDKTLAIIIGMIAGVILLVVFASFIGKQCQKFQDGK